ncbi:MAG: DHH family phosphoesterase, partial [Gammaproteobacteria bacterium]|nr:DHH family phosphoesterase [Gammaproteobacteria bacterium]
YPTPFAFIEGESGIYHQLEAGYAEDMAQAMQTQPLLEKATAALYILDDAPWARRVSGVFANQLLQLAPQRAHAILTHHHQGGYIVSVRAPAVRRSGADRLCSRYATGGGRKGAAGINHLPQRDLDRFSKDFVAAYS